jgi:hypothetical protein
VQPIRRGFLLLHQTVVPLLRGRSAVTGLLAVRLELEPSKTLSIFAERKSEFWWKMESPSCILIFATSTPSRARTKKSTATAL